MKKKAAARKEQAKTMNSTEGASRTSQRSAAHRNGSRSGRAPLQAAGYHRHSVEMLPTSLRCKQRGIAQLAMKKASEAAKRQASPEKAGKQQKKEQSQKQEAPRIIVNAISDEIIIENAGTPDEKRIEISEIQASFETPQEKEDEEKGAEEDETPFDSIAELVKEREDAKSQAGTGIVSDEHAGIIEAALFMSSRPLSLQEIGKLIGVAAPGFVEQKVKALANRYAEAQSAIEIADEDGKYSMRVRHEFVPHVRNFAQAAEISQHALKTLAYVAKSEGITKRSLFLKLGSGIYDDISELAEKGFITQKKSGRTKSVSTTPKFKAYFGN